MSILVTALAATFGKAAAERIFQTLENREGGSERLANVLGAVKNGATAIEAMKNAFGKDFLVTLNEVFGTSSAYFTYEAGTKNYIYQVDNDVNRVRILRDELNINLDRLMLLSVKGCVLKNHVLGVVSVWGQRCRDLYKNSASSLMDIESTLNAINILIKGESQNYKEIYKILLTTGLSGVGSLMVIAGASIATGTGVGVVTSISILIFGIPWVNVGALVILGVIMILMSSKKTRPIDDISLSISLANKLLERLEKKQ